MNRIRLRARSSTSWHSFTSFLAWTFSKLSFTNGAWCVYRQKDFFLELLVHWSHRFAVGSTGFWAFLFVCKSHTTNLEVSMGLEKLYSR